MSRGRQPTYRPLTAAQRQFFSQERTETGHLRNIDPKTDEQLREAVAAVNAQNAVVRLAKAELDRRLREAFEINRRRPAGSIRLNIVAAGIGF